MCKELRFKPLTAEQIEVKVTDTKFKGKATLLLYIDSRAAADILNEAVGVFNLEIKYKDVGGQIYGSLSIYDEQRNIWVTKEDTGEESNISEKKGQASDILKRCIARWGCDWLYRTPRIKVNCPESYYFNDKLCEKFAVRSIAWDEDTKECTDLVIVDHLGHTVYDLQQGGTNIFNAQNNTGMRVPPAPAITERALDNIDNKASLIEFCKATKAEIGDNDQLTKFFRYYEGKCAEWTKYKVNWGDKWNKWNQPKNTVAA